MFFCFPLLPRLYCLRYVSEMTALQFFFSPREQQRLLYMSSAPQNHLFTKLCGVFDRTLGILRVMCTINDIIA